MERLNACCIHLSISDEKLSDCDSTYRFLLMIDQTIIADALRHVKHFLGDRPAALPRATTVIYLTNQ